MQLEEDFVKANPEWVHELQIMVRAKREGGGARRRWIGGGWIGRLALTLMSSLLATARRDSAPPARLQLSSKVKAEIQALSSFGFQYLTHQYLPLKLQEGDWI